MQRRWRFEELTAEVLQLPQPGGVMVNPRHSAEARSSTAQTRDRQECSPWFGGTFNANTGGFQATSTDRFQIVSQGGEHVSPNGKEFFFNFGTCE